jgi:hypothetical protein
MSIRGLFEAFISQAPYIQMPLTAIGVFETLNEIIDLIVDVYTYTIIKLMQSAN